MAYPEFDPSLLPQGAPRFSFGQRFSNAVSPFLGNRDLALALLANSGGPTRQSFGQILGQSGLQAQAMQQQRQDDELRQQLLQAQIAHLNAPPQERNLQGAYQPGDYTPKSWAAFLNGGMKDPGILERNGQGNGGALYRYLSDKGPVYGYASDAIGKRPYEPDQKQIAPPTGFRYKPDGSLEPVPGGPADPAAGKGKITDNERLSAAYATRMRKAADTITALNYVPTTADMMKFNYMLSGPGFTQSMANKTLSPEAQQYLQAVQDFNRAKLRKESGAAIGKEEVFGDLSTFFPVPGDDEATLAQKQKARETAIEGMIGAAGAAYRSPNLPAGVSPPPSGNKSSSPGVINWEDLK